MKSFIRSEMKMKSNLVYYFQLILLFLSFLNGNGNANGIIGVQLNENELINWFPYQAPHTIRALSLTTRNIYAIDAHTFDMYYNLDTLYLSENKIERLDERTFGELRVLRKLDLGHNRLSSTISKRLLESQRLLVDLNLENNFIRTIEFNAFEATISLSKLNLAFNQLSHIDAGLFKGLTLSELNLSGNQLMNLEARTFLLPNLQGLYLSHNKLSDLNEQTFFGAENLRYLYLNNNSLSRIGNGTFGQLKKLFTLRLDSNPITFDLPATTNWLSYILNFNY